jgi:hypothetical protein
MNIANGFGNSNLRIQINGKDNNAEVWIEQQKKIVPEQVSRVETLSYATIEEIKALRDECNEALKKMIGL